MRELAVAYALLCWPDKTAGKLIQAVVCALVHAVLCGMQQVSRHPSHAALAA